MADFLLAAWLVWMTPLLAALSRARDATCRRAAAVSRSPASAASRKLRTAVFREDLTDLLRSRAFSLVRMRLICDLMLATLRRLRTHVMGARTRFGACVDVQG